MSQISLKKNLKVKEGGDEKRGGGMERERERHGENRYLEKGKKGEGEGMRKEEKRVWEPNFGFYQTQLPLVWYTSLDKKRASQDTLLSSYVGSSLNCTVSKRTAKKKKKPKISSA